MKIQLNLLRIIILAFSLILFFLSLLLDKSILVRFLEITVSPDHSISRKLANEINIFQDSILIFSIIVICSAILWDHFPKFQFKSPYFKYLITIYLCISCLMYTHTLHLLIHRFNDTYHMSTNKLQKYMLKYITVETFNMYQMWAQKLPRDSRILLINHEPPWFISYYLYPRIIFFYQRDNNTIELNQLPKTFLIKNKVGWVVDGNKLIELPIEK